MTDPNRSRFLRLSPDRAFVVQLGRSTGDDPEHFAGRVEHLSSGRAALFGSLHELYAFMGEVPEDLDDAAGAV